MRNLTGLGKDQVATLRYMRDDGELEFSPFDMRSQTARKICKLADAIKPAPHTGRAPTSHRAKPDTDPWCEDRIVLIAPPFPTRS